jgi:hypothetical protein
MTSNVSIMFRVSVVATVCATGSLLADFSARGPVGADCCLSETPLFWIRGWQWSFWVRRHQGSLGPRAQLERGLHDYRSGAHRQDRYCDQDIPLSKPAPAKGETQYIQSRVTDRLINSQSPCLLNHINDWFTYSVNSLITDCMTQGVARGEGGGFDLGQQSLKGRQNAYFKFKKKWWSALNKI